MFSLFQPKRRRRRQKYPTPPWIKWLIIGFLAYALLTSQHQESPVGESLEKMSQDVKASINLPEYKNKLIPASRRSLDISDTAAGKGNPAICGQEVKVAYSALAADGNPFDNGADKEKPLTFRIGDGKAIPAIEQSITGLKPEGKRRVTASSDMASVAPDPNAPITDIRFEIELLEAKPSLPDLTTLPFRITDMKPGNGNMVLCGQKVDAKVTLWNLAGKKIDESAPPFQFTPGKSEVFLGLEQGVIGMRRGGMRTLIVPPQLQKTLRGNEAVITFLLPENQTILVDVEILP